MIRETAVRELPEFRARRTAPPRIVDSFASQLQGQVDPRPEPPPRMLSGGTTVYPAAPPRLAAKARPAPVDPAELSARGKTERTPRAASTDGEPERLTPERAAIIERASKLLGLPYVWGGNSDQSGLDCSSYLSRAWGVSRQTTDTLASVADPITKEELRAGDAMNLPTWEDPARYGHVRIFDRWADPERKTMWVYESTSDVGGSVHRVIPYNPRYQPMRLRTLNDSPRPVGGW